MYVFQKMDILAMFKRYQQNGRNVRRLLVQYGTSGNLGNLTKQFLKDVDEGVLPRLLVHWIVYKGGEETSYQVYFKVWETRTIGQVLFRKKTGSKIFVRRVRKMDINFGQKLYHWELAITYDDLTKQELDKSMMMKHYVR